MTVIQGPMPAAAPNTKLGQSNPQDRVQAEAFGLSMLLALIAPQATPVSPQASPVSPQPTNEAPRVLSTDQHPEGESATGQQLVTKEEVASGSPVAIRRASITPATAELSTLPPPPNADPNVQVKGPVQSAPDPGQSVADVTLPETRAASHTIPVVDEETGRTETPTVRADVLPTRPRGVVPLVSETSQPVRTTVPVRTETLETKAAPPQVTIESAEVSSRPAEPRSETPLPKDRPFEPPARNIERPIVVTRPAAADEPARPSNASMSARTVESVAHESATHTRNMMPPVEGKPVQRTVQDTVPIATPALEEEPVPRQPQVVERREQLQVLERQAPQRQRPGRIRPTLTVRERPAVREQTVSSAADLDAGRADTIETTRAERVLDRAVDGEPVQTSVSPKRPPSPRVGPSPQIQSDVAAPVVGVPPRTGSDSAAVNHQVTGQIEQTVLNTPAEEVVFQPKPEDRVTLRFTDEAGVEGRVRVALRGESVRATIVSSDPATAERIGAGVSELQRALDKQGFRDPQITVQHAKPPEEAGNVAIASGVRAGQEIQGGSPTGRTLEDQANRERQQPSTRDHQHQNSGRSQQRSRERQER